MHGVESLPVLIKELPSTWIIDANGAIVGKMNYTNGLWLRPIHAVMAGLVPAIHAFEFIVVFKTWMPATSAGMTSQN